MNNKPEIFTRNASGLVRQMSSYSAFCYNVLAIGILFPWVYLWASAAFPKANIPLGILLTGIMLVPMWLAYAWISSAMPRSGGDYVFQTRIFSGWLGFSMTMMGAFMSVMYAAFAGWMLNVVGLAPMLAVWSYKFQSKTLLNIAQWLTSPWGVITVSLIVCVYAGYNLVRGMGYYVKVQWFFFYGLIISIVAIIYALATGDHATFVQNFNGFYAWAGTVDAPGGLFQYILDGAVSEGVNLNPGFSWWQTLGVSTIAANSLVWAVLAVQQLGEIKGAGAVKNTTFFMVGAGIFSTLVMAIIAFLLIRLVGNEFMLASGHAWLTGSIEFPIQPWLGLLGSVAVLTSPLLVFIICIGFVANAIQVMHNVMIQAGRITFAASLDRLFPEWVSKVHPKWHSPVNLHILLAALIFVFILLYNLWPAFGAISLSAAAAFSLYFIVTLLACTLFPYLGHVKPIYNASPIAKYKIAGIPWITICGILGAAVNLVLLAYYMLVPELGVYSTVSMITIVGSLVFFMVYYLIAKAVTANRGIDVELAFRQLPPD